MTHSYDAKKLAAAVASCQSESASRRLSGLMCEQVLVRFADNMLARSRVLDGSLNDRKAEAVSKAISSSQSLVTAFAGSRSELLDAAQGIVDALHEELSFYIMMR